VITESLEVSREAFKAATGWAIKPQGACKAEMCVPLGGLGASGDTFDVTPIAERMGMPIVHDETRGVWAIGPDTIGKVLKSAEAPELTLPEYRGGELSLSSLRGKKVLLLAWASW
jgi:hypothetical protein